MPQHFADGALHLEHCKLLANTVARTRRKGSICKYIDIAAALRTKTFRIEFLWVREIFWITLGVVGEHYDVCQGGESLAIYERISIIGI